MKAPNFFVFSLLAALIPVVFQIHPLQAMEEKEEVVLRGDVKMMSEQQGQDQDIDSLRKEVKLLKEQLNEALENINGLKRDFYKEKIGLLDFEINTLFAYIKDLEKPELTFQEVYEVLKKLQEDRNHFEWKKIPKWDEILLLLNTQMIGQMIKATEIGSMKAIINKARSPISESEKSKSEKLDLKDEIYRQLMECDFKEGMPNYCPAHQDLCNFLRETIDRKMTIYGFLYGSSHSLSKQLN